MARLADTKKLLIKTARNHLLKKLSEVSSSDEDKLHTYGELPASRAATIKTAINILKVEFTTLRTDINGASTLADLKTVFKTWIGLNTSERNNFRNALGKGFEILEQ